MLDKLDLKVRFRRKSFGRRKPRKLSIVQIMFFLFLFRKSAKTSTNQEYQVALEKWEVGVTFSF